MTIASTHTARLLVRPALPLALAVLALAAGGCGGGSSSGGSESSSKSSAAPSTSAQSTQPATGGTPAPAGVLAVAANTEGQLSYSTNSLTAKAGKVAIAFTNMAPLSHNLTVASSSGAVQGATPTFQGSTKTLSLTLKPGTYKFYCTVPGHRQAGMEGTLVVK